MANERDFVCEDCEAIVFEFGAQRTFELCNGCETIRAMKAAGKLTPKQEADLREIMHCQLPSDDEAMQ